MKTFLMLIQQVLLLFIFLALMSGCVTVRTEEGFEVPIRYDRETNCLNYIKEEQIRCMNSDNDRYYDPYYKERHEKRKYIKYNVVAWFDWYYRYHE